MNEENGKIYPNLPGIKELDEEVQFESKNKQEATKFMKQQEIQQ